ncbi:hypothetical protein [Bacillus thuringiensis]|nr:hypothetical protein [Bacillus thuringiensis]
MKYRRYIFKHDNDKKAAIMPLFIFKLNILKLEAHLSLLQTH